ncbi:hypothetical protein RFI_28341 [Reticulomyxa filosa]|uniref:Uncharacterized protein n=1 Tax=Reticulomyxa filosa TaxID=46433 RepID=X6M6F7_RETFI|nr:hypothetical protein RFI_28341 [Reticulomyxa filosa]|eukprot:ETO09047.1 hypothetical protein RFI_28341 [Reticulomyxa filosa]
MELKRMQTVSPNDYQKVFLLDNKDDKFYFGRGDVQFCDRFDAIFSVRESSQMVSSAHTPTNRIYFGHVECLIVSYYKWNFAMKLITMLGGSLLILCPRVSWEGFVTTNNSKSSATLECFCCVCVRIDYH